MSSTDELLREVDGTQASEEERAAEDDGGLLTRMGAGVGRVFSLKAFIVAVVTVALATVVAGTLIPLGSVGGIVGAALGAFGYGLLASRPRYVETAIAGGAVLGIGTLADYLVITAVSGIGLALPLAGAAIGLVVALLGHYFGRDLRDGLTREI